MSAKSVTVVNPESPAPAEWFYHWQWHPESLGESTGIALGAILIFGERNSLEERVSQLLDSNKYPTYFVTPGAYFSKRDNHFTINTAGSQDYDQLIATIKAEGLAISTVIHLWNYNQEPISVEELSIQENSLNQSFWSLQWLAQAFAKQYPNHNLNLLLVTQGAYISSEADTLGNLHQSMAGTLVRVLSLDSPKLPTLCCLFPLAYCLDQN